MSAVEEKRERDLGKSEAGRKIKTNNQIFCYLCKMQ